MHLPDAFFQQSPLSIALYDADGRLAFGNAAYERHFGIRVADVPASFSLFTDAQLAAAGVLEQIRRAYAGSPVVLPPVRYDAAQVAEGGGRTVWTEGHCFPLRGADGAVTHLAIVHLDVTAWATTDAALRELTASSEAARAVAEQERSRLDAVLSQLPAAVAVYEGPELRVRAMSAAYRRLINDRDAIGRPVREALADLDGQGFFELMERAYTTGTTVSGTNVPAVWDADGDGEPERMTIDYSYGPLRNAAGEVDGVVAVVVDASERQRLHEAELRVTERQAALLETIQDAFVAFDRELRLTYVNRRAEELLRHSASSLLGRTLDEAFPQAIGTPIRLAIQAALDRGESIHREEWSAVTRGWVDVRVSPAPDGVTLLMQDITARRREQEATAFMAEASRLLSASLDYQETLGAVAAAAVPRLGDWCAVDVIEDPRANRWPPTVTRLAAAHRDPTMLPVGLALARRPDMDWSSDIGLAKVLREGVPHFVPQVDDSLLERVVRDPDQQALVRSMRITSAIVVPLVAHGHVLGAITLCLSEGDRRYDEMDLALAQDLAQRAAIAVDNARHYRDAERARTEAEEANRTKSQFLATMSHELRTPLNAIAGHVQLLDMELHGPVTAAQRDALTRVERAQRHLLGLINDVLSFARLESGFVEYAVEKVALEELVRDIAPMVEPQLRAQGLTFDIRLGAGGDAEPSRVFADREKLGQVLLNLISNAIKFTPSGGRVTLELVSRADGTGPRDTAYLRVSDTGIGIPEDKLEVIFDPFVQVRRSTYMPGEGGTGLGLAISRDLARGMGGELRARSVLGKGSTFTVALRRA